MFGISSPRRSSHPRRNFTLRRSTPTMQCSVGERERSERLDSVPDSGPSFGNFSLSSVFSGGFTDSGALSMNQISHTTTTLLNDFFGSFKSLHEHAREGGETIALDVKIKPAYFIGSVIIAIALSTIMTLIYATHGVTKGYVLRDLQSQSQSLIRENEKVNMQVAQAQSLDSMIHNDVLLHMRPVANVVYLGASNTIARR